MFMDTVKEDVKMVGVPEQVASGRVRWCTVLTLEEKEKES